MSTDETPQEENIPASEENTSEQERKERAEESQKIDPSQIPPASFSLMLSMFSTQAMSALGILPNPITGKAETQLPLAKHYIELLAVLEEKTKGNLEEDEKKLLENSLHELRMMYVQQSKK